MKKCISAFLAIGMSIPLAAMQQIPIPETPYTDNWELTPRTRTRMHQETAQENIPEISEDLSAEIAEFEIIEMPRQPCCKKIKKEHVCIAGTICLLAIPFIIRASYTW